MKLYKFGKSLTMLIVTSLLSALIMVSQATGDETASKALGSWLNAFGTKTATAKYGVVADDGNIAYAENIEFFLKDDPKTKLTIARLECSNAGYSASNAKSLSCGKMTVTGYKYQMSGSFLKSVIMGYLPGITRFIQIYSTDKGFIKNLKKGFARGLNEGARRDAISTIKSMTSRDVVIPADSNWFFWALDQKGASLLELLNQEFATGRIAKFFDLQVDELSFRFTPMAKSGVSSDAQPAGSQPAGSQPATIQYDCAVFRVAKAVDNRFEGISCENFQYTTQDTFQVKKPYDLRHTSKGKKATDKFLDLEVVVSAGSITSDYVDYRVLENLFAENSYVGGKGQSDFAGLYGKILIKEPQVSINTSGKILAQYHADQLSFGEFKVRQFSDINIMYWLRDAMAGKDPAADTENLALRDSLTNDLKTMWQWEGLTVSNSQIMAFDPDKNFAQRGLITLASFELANVHFRGFDRLALKDLTIERPITAVSKVSQVMLGYFGLTGLDVRRHKIAGEMRLIPLLDRFDLKDFSLSYKDKKVLSIGQIALNASGYNNFIPSKLTIGYQDIYVDLMSKFGMTEKIKDWRPLRDAGYKTVTIQNAGIDLSYQPKTGLLTLDRGYINSDDLLSLNATFGLSRIPRSVVDGDFSPVGLTSVLFDNLTVEINQAKILPRILPVTAKKLGLTIDQLKQKIQDRLVKLPKADKNGNDIRKLVARFLDTGKHLKVILKPASSVPFISLPLVVFSGGNVLVNALGVSVEGE